MSDPKQICYFLLHLIVEDGAVHYIADDMHDLSCGVFEVEEYGIDEEDKPNEMSIIGCSKTYKTGLHFLRYIFYEHWKEQITSVSLHFCGAYDGNYGIFDVPRELTSKNTIRIEDVFEFFFHKKCGPLFDGIDGAVQTMGIKNWPICLTELISAFILVDADFCFFAGNWDEKVQVALEYGKKHDKNVFKEEHAKLIAIGHCCERKNEAYGRKFGEPRVNIMDMW